MLIQLKEVSVKVGEHFTLSIPEFYLQKGENWLVTGPNASGKSTFGELLAGKISYAGEAFFSFETENGRNISHVSPGTERHLFLDELKNDDSEYKEGGVDFGRTARDIIEPELKGDAIIAQSELERVVDLFQIRHILAKGFRFLSSGETRKVLIARSLLSSPELLILDDPFSGLDQESRAALNRSLAELMRSGLQIVLITSPSTEFPEGINRILVLERGRVSIQGERRKVVSSEFYKGLFHEDKSNLKRPPAPLRQEASCQPETLICVKNLSVSYYGRMVFRNLNWSFRKGEHWTIVGPNGAGKSTLLSMISGDNPKAYGKEMWIFGKKRGSGESIWEIKKQIGLVSPELHRNYRVGGTLLSVLLSGFFDSIGVYEQVTSGHITNARAWLHMAGLAADEGTAFDQLSFGRQRLALVLRAMVKHPALLILDEPCHGLDGSARDLVLKLMTEIALQGKSHLLHVTHDPKETTAAMTHRMIFQKREDGVFEAKIERMQFL